MLSSKNPGISQASVTAPTSSTAAAEEVADNEDLLVEIFLRLPIPSLLRFKSVSKRWLSLISNPGFSHRRITFRPNAPSGIFLRRSSAENPGNPVFDYVNLSKNPSPPPLESLGFVHQRNGFTILQSCNGLMLCSNEGRSDFYIFNPTTNQFTTLPKLQTPEWEELGVNLAFDPSKSSNYKAICTRISGYNLQVEIYSSEISSWRPCQSTIPAPFSIRIDCGVYWNEAVHWIGVWENYLYYFHLVEEKFHEIRMPPVPEGWDERQVEYFGECGGHLNLIEIYDFRTLEIDVYEMQEDHSGWFVKYHVDLHHVAVAFPKMIPTARDWRFCKFPILSMIQGEIDEESYLVWLVSGEVVRVSVDGRRFEKLVDIAEEPEILSAVATVGFGQVDSYLYIESLACV